MATLKQGCKKIIDNIEKGTLITSYDIRDMMFSKYKDSLSVSSIGSILCRHPDYENTKLKDKPPYIFRKVK